MSRTLVAFEIGATGQRIYVDPAHVYAVYDQPAATAAGEWRKLHAGVPVGAITRDACQERCAMFGDPMCHEVQPGCKPCADCVLDAGLEIPPELDPNAVVRPLL